MESDDDDGKGGDSSGWYRVVVGGGAIDGAWRIIMARLTLARAVGRASRVTARPLARQAPRLPGLGYRTRAVQR